MFTINIKDLDVGDGNTSSFILLPRYTLGIIALLYICHLLTIFHTHPLRKFFKLYFINFWQRHSARGTRIFSVQMSVVAAT